MIPSFNLDRLDSKHRPVGCHISISDSIQLRERGKEKKSQMKPQFCSVQVSLVSHSIGPVFLGLEKRTKVLTFFFLSLFVIHLICVGSIVMR